MSSTPHSDFQDWISCVRDPAKDHSEGIRRLTADGAVAEYEIAGPLPSGLWTMRMRVAYTCGNCSGTALPWKTFPTREACLDHFLETARTHFLSTGHLTGSSASEKQIKAQQAMLEQLTSAGSLFGFVEPDPEKELQQRIR